MPSFDHQDLAAIARALPSLEALHLGAAITADQPCAASLPRLRHLCAYSIRGLQLQAFAPAIQSLRLLWEPNGQELRGLGSHSLLRELQLRGVSLRGTFCRRAEEHRATTDLSMLSALLPALRALRIASVVDAVAHCSDPPFVRACLGSWAAGWTHLEALTIEEVGSRYPYPVDIAAVLPPVAERLGGSLRELVLGPCTFLSVRPSVSVPGGGHQAGHPSLEECIRACVPMFGRLERLVLAFSHLHHSMMITDYEVDETTIDDLVVDESSLEGLVGALAASRPPSLRRIELRLPIDGPKPCKVSWRCCQRLMSLYTGLVVELVSSVSS